MKGEANKLCSVLISDDLRPKKRREGEELQAFESIIGRSVPSPRTPKTRRLKYDRLRPHEKVIWEAPS